MCNTKMIYVLKLGTVSISAGVLKKIILIGVVRKYLILGGT